mmetsp:Transcript_107113/g.160152  ORF Transcript_107113/g.160152 Transcript_107113/m.160152 type:complete len:89 (-) Transcript_107113:809-1075(-)
MSLVRVDAIIDFAHKNLAYPRTRLFGGIVTSQYKYRESGSLESSVKRTGLASDREITEMDGSSTETSAPKLPQQVPTVRRQEDGSKHL